MVDSPKVQPNQPDLTPELQKPEPSFAQKIIAEDESKAQNARLQSLSTQTNHSKPQTSNYRPQNEKSNQADTQQSFGRKINVNAEVARQNEVGHPEVRMPSGQTMQQERQIQKSLPEAPLPQDLTKLMGSNLFQGPLKGGPVFQKLEHQVVLPEPQIPGLNPKNMNSMLERGELLQLFSMRNRPTLNKEEQESLRRLVKYEAALANRARVRVTSVEYQTESNRRNENPDALIRSEKTQNQDSVHRDLLDKLARSAESLFERVLQKVLGSNRSAVNTLPEGASPELPVKSAEEWEAFFKNTTGLSSELQEASAEQSKLSEVLFRGLYRSQGQLKLVSDLSLSENGEINQYKFAQILLSDPKLAELLRMIKPGQSLPAELLKALGEQVAFLKLVHMQSGMQELSAAEKQLLLKEFQREVSKGYQSTLEKQLRERRSKKLAEPFIWAGDQFDKKAERKGVRTVVMYLIYLVLICSAGLIAYFVSKQFL